MNTENDNIYLKQLTNVHFYTLWTKYGIYKIMYDRMKIPVRLRVHIWEEAIILLQ